MIVVLVILSLWLTGYALQLLLRPTSPPLYSLIGDLPSAMAIGVILAHLQFLVFCWFGPVPIWLYGLLPGFLVTMVAVRRRRAGETLVQIVDGPFPYSAVAGLAVLLIIQFVLLLPSLGLPLFDWDARILWALKARVLADQGTLRTEFFTDPYRLHIHPRYPLLVPWLAGTLSAAKGAYAEGVYRGVILAFACLTTWQLYLVLAARSGLRLALGACLVLVLTGAWLSAQVFTQVEPALAFFFLLAIARLGGWLESGKASDLVLGGLFLAGCVLTKNEGLLLLACCSAALFIVAWRKSGLRKGAAAAAMLVLIAVLFVLPWLLQRAALPAVSDEAYLQRLTLPILADAFARVPAMLAAIFRQMTEWHFWHLFWPCSMLISVRVLILWRRAGSSDLLASLAWWGYLLGILFVYGISPWRDIALQIDVTFNRVVLPLLPVGLLLLTSLVDSSGRPGCDG